MRASARFSTCFRVSVGGWRGGGGAGRSPGEVQAKFFQVKFVSDEVVVPEGRRRR